jgi:hypothetical protein
VAVSSYVSAQIVTAAPEQATRFARGVDHSGPSFEARVFSDNEGATAETPNDDPSYIGSFRIFGHGDVSGKKDTATCRGGHKMRLISDLRTSCCPTQ